MSDLVIGFLVRSGLGTATFGSAVKMATKDELWEAIRIVGADLISGKKRTRLDEFRWGGLKRPEMLDEATKGG